MSRTYGDTPLHLAAKEGDIRLCEELINKYPNLLNAPNEIGNTPISHAITMVNNKEDREKLVDLFLSKGANLKIRNEEGETPLHRAATRCVEICKKILEKDHSLLHELTYEDETPLHYAIGTFNPPGVVDYLIKKGSDLHQKDLHGWGLYMFAFKEGENWDERKEVWDILHKNGRPMTPQEKSSIECRWVLDEKIYEHYTKELDKPLVKGRYPTGPTYGSGGGGGGGGGGGVSSPSP